MGMSEILKPRILLQWEIKENGLRDSKLMGISKTYSSRILVQREFEENGLRNSKLTRLNEI